MQKFRVWWNAFKTVALLLSFTLNMVFLITLLLLLMQVFQLKNGVVEPLVDDLHGTVGDLDQAVIATTVPIQQDIPVSFDVPIQKTIDVTLTDDVPVAANASFTLPGGGGVINGRVDVVLPRGSILPIRLDTTVPVDASVPVDMSVDVSIAVADTQLHAPLQRLTDLLSGYASALDDLPDSWGEVPDYVRDQATGSGSSAAAN